MKHEIILRGETLCLAVCNVHYEIDIDKLPAKVDREKLKEYIEGENYILQVPFMRKAELEIDGEVVKDFDCVDLEFEKCHFRGLLDLIQPFYMWWMTSKPRDEWKWEVEDDDFDPKQFKIKIIANEVPDAHGGIILWEVSYRGERLDPVGPFEKYLHEEYGDAPRLTYFDLEE